MKKILKAVKWVLLGLLFLLLLWGVFNISLISYGISQLRGQLKIINNAREMEEVLLDKSVSDSIKVKIRFIEEVKKFAIDSLGLKASENYTTFYDQHNQPLLWVITASEPYRLKAYQWKFPLLGRVSYKGFFDYEKGKREEEELKEEGYDTDYDDVSAWSTLGWFKDPVLSNMIKRGKGQIAELIIHEMTHATLYVRSNVDFNENLASVCSEQGAVSFLRSTYGDESEELREYIFRKEDYDRFSNHMLAGTRKLDSLYRSMNDSIVIFKKSEKDKMIDSIVVALDTVSFHSKKRYKDLFIKQRPNNAYFLNFIRYDAQKEEMKRELNERFGGRIKNYLDYLKAKY
jgi:predicted aminopeptidase